MTSRVYIPQKGQLVTTAQEIARRVQAEQPGADLVLRIQDIAEAALPEGVRTGRQGLLSQATKLASEKLQGADHWVKAAALREVSTRLEFAEDQRRKEEAEFTVSTHDLVEVAPLVPKSHGPIPTLSGAVNGLGSLSAALKSEMSHDMWLRSELDRTVLPAAGEAKSDRDIAVRTWAMPFEDLRLAAHAELDATAEGWLQPAEDSQSSSLGVWRQVLDRNWAGNLGGQQAVLDIFDPTANLERRGDGADYVKGARELPDGIASLVEPAKDGVRFHLTSQEKAFLVNLLTELNELWNWSEEARKTGYSADHQDPAFWNDRFPRAWRALAGAHDRYVQHNVVNAEEERNPDNLVPFLKQSLRAKLRNLPTVVCAVTGLLDADRMVTDFLKGKPDARDDLLAALQDQLILSQNVSPDAAEKTEDKRYEITNSVHARAVSDLASLGMTEMLRVRGKTASEVDVAAGRALLERIHPIVYDTAKTSGLLNRQLGSDGKAADAAPKVAMERLPKLLEAAGLGEIDPKDVLGRMRLEDYVKLGERFGVKYDADGATLENDLHRDYGQDPYFGNAYKTMRARGPGEAPLTEKELDAAELALRLFAVAWISQQVHRAEQDPSRADLMARGGVYNYYDTMVQAPGTPMGSLLNLMKDAAVALGAYGLVPQG